MQDFQHKSTMLSQGEAQSFVGGMRAQSLFLENLERRLAVCRERMGGIYATAMSKSAVAAARTEPAPRPSVAL